MGFRAEHANGYQQTVPGYTNGAGEYIPEGYKNSTCDPAACEILTLPHPSGLNPATVRTLTLEQHGAALTRRYMGQWH
jgi:hypothetical protein